MTSIASTIAAVETSIAPIGNKVSGMPIHAANFNTLVEAIRQLLSIARLQESGMRTLLEAQFALKEHEHPSAVTMNWLDGDLRARIGDGALQLRETIDGVGASVKALGDELARLRRVSGELQRSVDQFRINDADRTAAIRTIEQRIVTLAESIRSLRVLGEDLALIKTKFALLQTVLDTLTVGGKTIDVGALRNDVLEHARLLENLNDAAGTPIRILTLQQKIRELESISGLGEGLEQRLASIGGAIQVKLDAALDAARKALQARIDTNVNAIATLEKRLTDVAKTVDANVTAAGALDRRVTDQDTRLDANVRALSTLDKRLTDQATAGDRRFGELTTKTDAVSTSVTALDKRVTDQAAAADKKLGDFSTKIDTIDKRLTGQITTADKTIVDLSKKVDATSTSLTALDNRVTDQATAVEKRLRDLPTKIDATDRKITELSKKVDGTDSSVTALDKRLTELSARVDAIEGRVTEQGEVIIRFDTDLPVLVERQMTTLWDQKSAAFKDEVVAIVDKRIVEEVKKQIDQAKKAILNEVRLLILNRPT